MCCGWEEVPLWCITSGNPGHPRALTEWSFPHFYVLIKHLHPDASAKSESAVRSSTFGKRITGSISFTLKIFLLEVREPLL